MSNVNILSTHEGARVPHNINVNLEKKDIRFIYDKGFEIGVINFCGIVIDNDNILVSYPKKYSTTNSTHEKNVEILFQTIMKHFQNNQDLYLNKTTNLRTNYPFNYFYNIYEYYKKYGLYHEEIRTVQEGYGGTVSWKDTIKKSSKVISKQGLVFLPLQIKKQTKKHVFISECMVFAINYTLNKFNLFLKMKQIDKHSLNMMFVDNKEYLIRELHSLKNEVFKDIQRKLIDDLINFFSNLPEGGHFELKHYTFSTVWEHMVSTYLNCNFDHYDSLNHRIMFDIGSHKNLFKKSNFQPNKSNEEQFFSPDHYLALNDTQLIFDAKYYSKINTMNYKQIAYHLFLSRYRDSVTDENPKYKNTFSALILPSDSFHSRIHFQMKKNYNIENEDLVISEEYFDIKEVMEFYISQ